MLYVRHSEREDHHLPPNAKAVDPKITAHGVRQAEATGKYLKAVLEEQKITEIIIESSPFIRCLQTASLIAKELGKTQVKVNFLVCELLGNFLFEINPFPLLCLYKMKTSDLEE